MLKLVSVTMIASAWGWSSPHRDAFLSMDTVAVPTEGVGMQVSPVSTTMTVTINLTLQYMVVFTALGICRSYLDLRGQKYEDSAVQKALKHASETVFYAPMACLLFVGFRMRVLQLTKGQGNPQDFVQVAMQCVAYSILANTLLVIIIPVFTKHVLGTEEKEVKLDPKTGEMPVDAPNPFENAILATTFTCIRYACFLGLYVGFSTVIYGLFTFTPAPGVWDGPIPAVSPAVFCTCLLSCAFFTIYCLLAVSHTYTQFTEQKLSKFEEAMTCGADTLGLAPMFCVLFLAARMRALQMDPVSGNPQRWAQNCFYTCTWALMLQCLLAIAVPLALNGKVQQVNEKGERLPEGDMTFEVPQPMLAKVLTVARWFIMLGVYVAGTAVVCSVFTIEHPKGAEFTPPVSPTMQCVINFAFQYFLIYMLVWTFYTVEHFSGWKGLHFIKDAVESAKSTVQFAPMLCVLFIATRMRALQITDQQGAPQGYVQDGMYLATWSVLIQFLMCLILPFLTGHKYEVESVAGADHPIHDQETKEIKNYYGALTVTVLRYFALISLLGGLTAVITGVFLMTPENANGRGSINSATGVDQIPVVGEHVPTVASPPKATDIPGVEKGMEATGEGIGSGVNTVKGAGDATTGAVEGATSGAVDAVAGKK